MIKPVDKQYYDISDFVDEEIFIEALEVDDESDDRMLENGEHDTKLDASRLISETENFFDENGQLKHAERYGGRPYEYRSQQAEMAVKIACALATNANLCVEAPTGIGKSFAYLIPLIYFAKMSPSPVVVSTETINLQEQLIEKDIPLLQKLTGVKLTAALAKGRSNYLCLRRLQMATGDRRDEYLPLPSLGLDIDRIGKWSDYSIDGNRDSIDFRVDSSVWGYVCCEAGNCLGQRCSFFRKCFYWRARLQWEKADIIVANHALFFTDLKMKSEEGTVAGLLPEYSAAVIDEAHTLENNAAEYLGLRLNSHGLFGFLNRLFNPDNAKGLLLRAGEQALALREKIADIKQNITTFFTVFEQFLLENRDSIRRVVKPGCFPDVLSPKLSELRNMLADYSNLQDDKNFKAELEAQVQRCDFYLDGISSFINMSFPDFVYWIEEERGGISLQAAPLNVPELLDRFLFSQKFPVVLTSATLTVCKQFDYYRSRVGFTGGAELRLDSPFSHEQVKIMVPKEMPEPNHENYTTALLEKIPQFVSITHGKAFVLFTSYQTLRFCADNLRDFFDDNEINLLIQGEEFNRTTMLKKFRQDIDSVIFGTDSFWTGVDVPGEALSNVIVTKFPFAVPSHPLIQARCECITAQRKNAFMEYSLPEAVLKFRQGVGRLIRSRNDHGIIVILDRRAISKRYGRYFIESLPDYPIETV